ncbi:MAG: precorrin-6A reductase [Mogibacterium sp.]|nr:precorrin-6A reductase [Mogibacterium sp.]
MSKIVVFAGTTEGRQLSEGLTAAGVKHTVCVATEYGELLMKPDACAEVRTGRMSEEEILALLQDAETVYDATHPYAAIITGNLRSAAEGTGTRYIRIRRDPSPIPSEGAFVRTFPDAASCAEALRGLDGKILLTTGSKDLTSYTEDPDVRGRLYVRVLPTEESIRLCREAGIPANHLIAMQGPFTEEMNLATIRQYGVRCLVTKESGETGGYPEKAAAAARAGISLYVILRPSAEAGITVGEALAEWNAENRKEPEKSLEIDLVGIGPGRASLLTAEAAEAIGAAEILFGARRAVQEYEGRLAYPFYRAEDIIPVLQERTPHRIAILFSGDTGYFSGASSARQELTAWLEANSYEYQIRTHAGISSYAYMTALLGEDYTHAGMRSIHGMSRDRTAIASLIRAVRAREKVYVLLSGASDVQLLGELLPAYGLGHCTVSLGWQLSYPEEAVWDLTPDECREVRDAGLYLALIRNPHAGPAPLLPVRADEEYIRDRVPMTKETIRHHSILRLNLTENAVVCDIGSGTGSVACEIAGLHESLLVYAIERKPEACELIRKNAARFHLANLTLVEGTAPEALEDPAVSETPTHAFIGGSGGDLRKILACLYRKNPSMRVVINAVSLETMAEIHKVLQEFPVQDLTIEQISVSRARELGSYHLMTAENPVLIAAFQFGEPASDGN